MATILTQAVMEQIFAVTDALGISREAIQVPLRPLGEGSVSRLADGRIRIVLPEETPVDSWLTTLRRRLQEL